ncbi:hypothetical protein NEUTE2DRAFT_63390 [Neurospora tetrasperma FGSC 2509]|nr:hypothetical protein NEUTE2DRAFT_63390 [Neurospora tetrasperma FGSC 2509]
MPVSFDHAQRIPEFLEAAARVRDPNLVAYWKIIMTIQFTRRRAYDPHHRHFAESTYQWLVFLHRTGLTAEGLAKIGPTKPGLVEKLRRTLACHEITHARKKTRGNHPAGQAYKRIYMTEADFMVGEGAIEVLGYPTGQVQDSQVADIPTSEPDKVQFIDEMVTALKNMVGRDKGMEAQVKQVMATSASIFESLAWRLFTNKAAVSNLFLSNYFARFAADPYKERSTKKQNAKTNNDKADKKRAGDEAIATLAGNPLPQNTNATGGNVQAQANIEHYTDQAAQNFVAAAGAAGASVQGLQQPQEPVFARPQHINMANDGWINYQENDFEALYRTHEAQPKAYNAEVEAYNKQKNAAANGDSSDVEDDSENDDGASAHEDDNGEDPDEPNYGADYNDIFNDIYGVSDDETRERRRRQDVSAARAPAAPPNMNGRGLGPTMAGPPMPVLTTRPPPTQAGPAVQSHGSDGLVQQPAPRTSNQQVARRPFAVPAAPQNSPQQNFLHAAHVVTPPSVPNEVYGSNLPTPPRPQIHPYGPTQQPPQAHRPINISQGHRGQFQAPVSSQPQTNFASPAQQNIPTGLGTPARPSPHQVQAIPLPHGLPTVQLQSSAPMGHVQSPAGPLPDVVPRRIITPASERARLLRESQQPAVMGFPPSVDPNAPVQKAAEPQAAPRAPQSQPAHDWFDSSAALDNFFEPGPSPEQQMFFDPPPNQQIAQPALGQQQSFDESVSTFNQQSIVQPAPIQQAAVPEVHQPGEEELMMLFEQISNGQAPQQQRALPAAEQQVDIDPLEDLDLSLDNIMSDQELVDYAATQGFGIDINDLVQLNEAGSNNIADNRGIGGEVIDSQPPGQTVADNANEQWQQNNGVEDYEDLFGQFMNLPDEVDNIIVDDLFADEYMVNHAIEGLDREDGTGSSGIKRMRGDHDENKGEERPAQRARMN